MQISPAARDLIQRLMCDVEDRLGTRGIQEIKDHPFFDGIQWDRLYQCVSPYVPRVDHELDTQNFEHFDEEASHPSQVRPIKYTSVYLTWNPLAYVI